MARIIMHQSGSDSDLTAEQHLEEDRQLFQRVERGLADCLVRVWETRLPSVILGRNTTIDDHVIEEACTRDGVQVLRRMSGGGAVVLGRGCLVFAVALSIESRPQLADV